MKLVPVCGLSSWINVYRLYKKAFPFYERKSFSIIKSMNERKAADIWIINNKNSFAGFAITLNHEDLILLDYFAISPNMRGNGLGGKALRELQKIYSNKRLFLEIETTFSDSKNKHERLRRKDFYLKNGMSELGFSVNLFGTEMEVLGYECSLSFEEYKSIYTHYFGRLAEKNVSLTKSN